MDDSALSNQLLTLVRTKEEVHNVKEALDAYLSSKFSLQENGNEFAKLPSALTQLLKSILSTGQSVEKTKIIVDQLNSKLASCPLINMTIAFSPTESTIEKLTSKVKHMFGPDYMLDIIVDPSILGGITLIHDGEYQDLSYKKKLADAFNTKQEEIRSLLV